MMETTRFPSLRLVIAVLASLWFVAQVASVCESHPGLAYFQADQNEDEEHQSVPMPEDAEEEGDSDEEPDEAKMALRCPMETPWMPAAERDHSCDAERLNRWWLGLPPTPPPERG